MPTLSLLALCLLIALGAAPGCGPSCEEQSLPRYNPPNWPGFAEQSPHLRRTALFADSATTDTARLHHLASGPVTQTVRKSRPGPTCTYQVGTRAQYRLVGSGFEYDVDEGYTSREAGRGDISVLAGPTGALPCFQTQFTEAAGAYTASLGAVQATSCTLPAGGAATCLTLPYTHDPQTGCDTLGILTHLHYQGPNGLAAFRFRTPAGTTRTYTFVGYE
jgi:hypothetical protein